MDNKDLEKEKWIPVDYEPGLSVKDWSALLKDREVFTPSSLEVMLRFLDYGGQATCSQLSEKYGESKNYYNGNSSALAKRIQKKTNCTMPPKRSEDDTRWWPILFLGKMAGREEKGQWIYRLRDELKEALKQMDLSNVKLYARKPSIWKISEGELTTDEREVFESRHVVVVHGTTKAKATSKVSQGDAFLKEIKAGDFFYLCYGNSIQLIGEFIGEAVINPEKQDGWYEREYRFIKKSIDTGRYTGSKKWWAPSDNSTCIRVKNNEYQLFEKELLFPYFGITLQELLGKDYDRKGLMDTEVSQYKLKYSENLIESKNIIFRGAPGTGKTYLAKQIAADIISEGEHLDYTRLPKDQIEFVQFHPNYDYSDFVEGLRPSLNDDGSMSFELQDGIFKKFITRARKNYEESQKSKEDFDKEASVQEMLSDFLSKVELGVDEFETINKRKFSITDVTDTHIILHIPSNANPKLTLNINELRRMLESGIQFEMIKDITAFFGKTFATQGYSYDFALYKEIKKRKVRHEKPAAEQEKLKKYVFIIDEINRGEISKIFGELFFSIDPGYRGVAGAISTQYANLHTDSEEKFYIPENVYIIGTMNDIDRSVDTFDFAMRRRFRLIELKADEHVEMLDVLDDSKKAEAIRRMKALNKEIINNHDLNENYQIGAAYFLKLQTLSYDKLWTDYLEPLLREYVHGMYEEDEIMKVFANAYGYIAQPEEEENGITSD